MRPIISGWQPKALGAALFVALAMLATASTCYIEKPELIPWVETVPHEVDPEEEPLVAPFDSYTERINFELAIIGHDPLPPGAIVEPGGAGASDNTEFGAFDTDRLEIVPEPGREGVYRVYLDGEDYGTVEGPEGWIIEFSPSGEWGWVEAGSDNVVEVAQ